MKNFLITCLVVVFSCCSINAQEKKAKKLSKKPAFHPVEDVEGLPRVLLIGDSISIGYTVGVQKRLAGKANVHRPLTNCGPTTRGIEKIEDWLATGGKDKKWDLIHFNWGLHDHKYMGPNGENLADPKADTSKRQVSPTEYEKNLRQLTERLQKTGAKIIWRNTTPVPEGAKGRVVGDSVKYNQIAAKIMTDLGIPTHDLYTIAKNDIDTLMKPRNVHFTTEGSAALAEDVAKTIVQTLDLK